GEDRAPGAQGRLVRVRHRAARDTPFLDARRHLSDFSHPAPAGRLRACFGFWARSSRSRPSLRPAASTARQADSSAARKARPLPDVLGISLRALASTAAPLASGGDPNERDAHGLIACASVLAAKDFPTSQRNKICELRRLLEVLLLQNAGQALLNDLGVKKVL